MTDNIYENAEHVSSGRMRNEACTSAGSMETRFGRSPDTKQRRKPSVREEDIFGDLECKPSTSAFVSFLIAFFAISAWTVSVSCLVVVLQMKQDTMTISMAQKDSYTATSKFKHNLTEMGENVLRRMEEIVAMAREHQLAFDTQINLVMDTVQNTSSDQADMEKELRNISKIVGTLTTHIEVNSQHRNISNQLTELEQMITESHCFVSSTEVRLVGTKFDLKGRVEVYRSGSWGTVCDDDWDINDANVVCKMLGFARATSAPCCAKYGPGTGQIWLDNVGCSGSESSISSCSHRGWGTHNCGHGEDASVICEC